MSPFARFPSFQQLQASTVAAIGRFPLALFCAAVGTAAAITLAEEVSDQLDLILQRIIMCVSLGLPLFIVLALVVEKRSWPQSRSIILQAVGFGLLIGYYFSLPEDVSHFGSVILRHALLALGLHFSVAFLPYLGSNQTNGFWQYNTALFRRTLLATLYAGVLFAGLAIALGAGDHLFGMDIDEIRYLQLWTLMVGLVHPLILLSGVPRDLEALNRNTGYPKALGLFAQYILLPLVGLYFLILIAYEAKIIIEWNWPKGWVSELVLWFSVVGLLSLLILHPLRESKGKLWVQTFIRWFFRGLIPLVPLLFLAILRRISDYGVTEPRYLVVLMAIGLALLTIYFLFSRKRDIRTIPILLGLLALLAAYGPWSASSLSLSSQMGRLETFLIQNEMLEESELIEPVAPVSFDDRKEMSSIIRYVTNAHGMEPFEELLGSETLDSVDTESRYTVPNQITKALGFEFVHSYETADDASSFVISAPEEYEYRSSFVVTGHDYLVDFDLRNQFRQSYPLEDTYCLIDLDTLELVLTVTLGNDAANEYDSLKLYLHDPLKRLLETYDGEAPLAERTFRMPGELHDAELVLERVSGEPRDEGLLIRSFVGHLLIRRL